MKADTPDHSTAPDQADAPAAPATAAVGDAPHGKGAILHEDYRQLATFSGRFILIAAALVIAGFALKYVWTGLLPVLLALLVSTVLFPFAAYLRHKLRFPAAAAAATTMLGFFAIIGGVFTLIAPTIRSQGGDLVKQAEGGIEELGKLLEQLPVDINSDRIQTVLNDITNVIKNQASNIANGVITGFSAASSIVVALVIMLFLTFFMVKDGDRFLPFVRRFTGFRMGWHITELASRIWRTLSGFIQAQATVALVDAVLIGLGLWALQVPLAFAIGVVTFFASFIPMIGAIVAGALAVVIALVSNGLTNALLALLVVIIVQQVEGNVLQPMLQSKAMGLHATVVLLSVAVGSSLAGIVGAFLAVPVAATIAVVFRYHATTAQLRSGEVDPEEVEIVTVGEGPRHRVRELYRSLAPTADDSVA